MLNSRTRNRTLQFPGKSVAALAALWLGAMTTACIAAPAHDGVNLSFDDDGRPVTTAVLNNESEFLFAIDTAAQVSAVGAPIIEKLGLTPDPDNKAQLHGAGGVTEVNLYAIASLQVGDVVKTNILAPTLAHERPSEAEGIVGADVFRDTGIEFDFMARRFFLRAPAPGEAYEELPVELKYGVFVIAPVEINGVTINALIDTGAARSTANLLALKALGLSENDPGLEAVTEKIGVTGDEADFLVGFEGSVAFGSVTLGEVALPFSDLHVFGNLGLADSPVMVLGMDILGRLDGLGIDYERKALMVRR